MIKIVKISDPASNREEELVGMLPRAGLHLGPLRRRHLHLGRQLDLRGRRQVQNDLKLPT